MTPEQLITELEKCNNDLERLNLVRDKQDSGVYLMLGNDATIIYFRQEEFEDNYFYLDSNIGNEKGIETLLHMLNIKFEHYTDMIEGILTSIKLTEDQQRKYEAVRWLVNDGPRGSGRTYLLALAFVEKAITCGNPIRIWNHESNPNSFRYIIDMIVGIVHNLKMYELKVFLSRKEIMITHKPIISD
jgi:hypothetical protein